LLQKRRKFAAEFIRLRSQGTADADAIRQAAINAGVKPSSASSTGHQMLKVPIVRQTIEQAFQRAAERAKIDSTAIMQYWHDIATAELPLPPAGPCRNCWGEDHQYQYTLNEYRTAMRKHTSEQLKKSPHLRVPFDELGGIGFDRNKPPHPLCPECNGQGRNYMMVLDRDKLTVGQRMAVDEVRVHKDGSVSLKMRDRSRAMENLQSLMGLVQPRKPLEVIDPQRPIEENVDILIQTAIDQGLVDMRQPALLPPVIEHDGSSEQLADADAA
jgi:hypothetical protein